MTQTASDLFAHTSQTQPTEHTTRRPYLCGPFVVIPVIFYVLCKLSDQQTALYELLVRWSDDCGIVTRSKKLLAADLGCPTTSLRRHLHKFIDLGLLEETPWGHFELKALRPTTLAQLRQRADLELFAGSDDFEPQEALCLISCAITDDKRLGGSDRRVYGALAARVHKTEGTTFIGNARLADDLELSVATIKRSIKHLKELGYIKVRKEPYRPQVITLIAPEPTPQVEQSPLQIAPPTTPNCTPDHSKLHPITREKNTDTQHKQSNARAHGARNQGKFEADEVSVHQLHLQDSNNTPQAPELGPLLEQDAQQLEALTHTVLGEVPDPNAQNVPTLIRRRLYQGHTRALLTAALLSYRDHARYHLPASRFFASVLDKWVVPQPGRRPRNTSFSRRQRHAIESERRFKANLYVGAHEPRPQPTPQELEEKQRHWEAFLAHPLQLPQVTTTLSDDEQQEALWERVIRPYIKGTPMITLFDFAAHWVWKGEVALANAHEVCFYVAHIRPDIDLGDEEIIEAFEQALRRCRKDITQDAVGVSS